MKKMTCLLVTVLIGCASPQPEEPKISSVTEFEASEGVFITNKDYLALIQLYKDQLSKPENADNIAMRIKLIDAYVHNGDIDSAHFYLQHIPNDTPKTFDLNYTRGLVFFNDNQMTKARDYLKAELADFPDNAKAYNLLGVAFAYDGDYLNARESLNKTRVLHFNDMVVINNLAMVDILEHRYQDASRKLLPIYHSGQADDRVKVNLIIALAMQDKHPMFPVLVNDMLDSDQYPEVKQRINQLIAPPEAEL